MSLDRSIVAALFLALVRLGTPPTADAALTAQVNAGTLTVTMTGADDATVTCVSGGVKVNGANPAPATACAGLGKVVMTASGAFPNAIDLSSVTRALGFTGLAIRTRQLVDPPDPSNLVITIDGGPGDDAITASNDATIDQSVTGGAGSDTVTIGTGTPRLVFSDAGSPETDTIAASGATATYALDFLLTTAGLTADFNGGVGGEPLTIATQTNRLLKIAAADLGAHVARIDGSSAADTITTHATNGCVVDGHAGDDVFVGGAGDDGYVTGGLSGVDTITDTAGDNGLGFCNVDAGHGLHVDLSGGLGGGLIATTTDATLTVKLADPGDTATLDAFFQVEGTQGDDDITGNDSRNFFTDCGGNDIYRGKGGDDIFEETARDIPGGSGNDRYEGGGGNDTFRFACNTAGTQETDTVVELPGEGTDGMDLRKVEDCVATDVLTADFTSDTLVHIGPSVGTAHKLILTGAAGQAANWDDVRTPRVGDRVIGNAANNVIISPGLISGGPGNDTITGGTVTYEGAPGPVFVDLPHATATGEGTDTFVATLAAVIGSPFGDTMIGLSSNSIASAIVLNGADGNDTLFIGTHGVGNGGDDDDVLNGGNLGILNGDDGNDTITVALQGVANGGDGHDYITAMAGATANGGEGDDTLVAINFQNTLNGEGGNDTLILIGSAPNPLGVGSPTPNVANGDEGDDTIDARNEWPDTITCGIGTDLVLSDDTGDAADGACDAINPEGPKPPPDTTDLALLTCGDGAVTFIGASADASRVFFATTASHSSADTDGVLDVYERTPTALRLATGTGTAPVPVQVDQVADDGTLFFETTEALPGTGDTDTVKDIYQWKDGALTLATPGSANAAVSFFGISPDGGRVFFTTDEALLPADTDTSGDLYERDHGTLKLVSGPTVPGAPAVGFAASIFFGLSADGTHTYFSSTERLAPEDTHDNFFDLYQRVGDTVTLLSTGFTGNVAFGPFGAFFVGASADGTRVYFTTDVPLTPDDPDGTGFGSDLYVNDAGTLTLVPAPGAIGRFVTADGTLVLSTAQKLALADTDGSLDYYAWDGTSFTLLTGGSAEVEPRFQSASVDASRVVFSTVEALLPADVDLTEDVYQWENGVITLLSPGTAEIPAIFRGSAAEGDHVFFSSAEALVAEDVDTGVDVYDATAGGVVLLAAGTANKTTRYGGVSSDAAVLIFGTNEALLAGDGDATGDLYAVGPSGFPVEPICEEIFTEDCGNCVDDDGDASIDRADADCPPPSDGGGAGLADLKRQAKPAAKCQQALGKAGSKLAGQRVKRLQKCLTKVFACVQLKPGDAACLAKSGTACTKQFHGVLADRTKLGSTVAKACGAPKLALADLQSLAGVGFGVDEADFCARLGVASLDSVAAVADCVRRVHECRADELVGQQVPRARELLAAAGQNVNVAPCLPLGADGGGSGLDDPKGAGKRAVKCQLTLQKVGAKLVGQEQKLAQKCSAAVTSCLQAKPADPRCLPKARATCAKQIGKLTLPGSGVEAKLAAALAKSCGGPAFDPSTLFGNAGIGFQAHASECAALGVSTLAATPDVATCMIRLHECRAEQLLSSQIPRLRELLEIGGTVLP